MVNTHLLRRGTLTLGQCVTSLVALTASLVSISSQADTYLGINSLYSGSEFRGQTWQKGSPFLVQAQLGYFFNDHLAVEARHAASVKRDSGLAIDTLSSALIKANMPVSPRVAVYALGGYSYVNADLSNQSHSDAGLSFGVGLHYALSPTSALTSEWMNYLHGDDVRLNALQFGIQFKF